MHQTGLEFHVQTDEEELDLNTCKVSEFHPRIKYEAGYLERSFTASLNRVRKLKVNARRFLSMAEDEIGAIRYAV